MDSATVTTLHYVDADAPGYTRRRVGKGWHYFTQNDKIVRAPGIVARLKAIGLPPAYQDAWFAKDPRAHIQATGFDNKGRKQYRYHPDFVAARNAIKYETCIAFGTALPKLRAQIKRDLSRRDLSHERVIAAVVRLLDLGSVRVGNAAYAKTNHSFGATTLRHRHATVRGPRVMLHYVGKSGKDQTINIADARLARLIRSCQDLPGQALFQFLNADGVPQPVSSCDVNDYIRTNAGEFTAKHFRTWTASVIAFEYLVTTDGKRSMKAMLAPVSEKLGNTPAIARKSYVHPALIDAIDSGSFGPTKLPRGTRYLSRIERGLLIFLADTASLAGPASS